MSVHSAVDLSVKSSVFLSCSHHVGRIGGCGKNAGCSETARSHVDGGLGVGVGWPVICMLYAGSRYVDREQQERASVS